MRTRPTDTGYGWQPTSHRTATSDLAAVGGPGDRSSDAAPDAPPAAVSVADAVADFIAAAEDGRIVNRSGRPYQPSALRDLIGLLRYHVVPWLGSVPLASVCRADVQRLVDRLAAEGLSESRIRSAVSALRALFARAIEEGRVRASPVDGLSMPRTSDPAGASPPRVSWVREPDAPQPMERPLAGAWEERPRPEPDCPEPDRAAPDAYEPVALLPDGMLASVLRAVFLLVVVLAVVSLVESL